MTNYSDTELDQMLSSLDRGLGLTRDDCYGLIMDVRCLRQALKDVINPIGKLKREMEPGRVLDGVMACRWAEMPSTLQEIARKALEASAAREAGQG